MSRLTYIYWLIDTRPETVAKGWHSGYPFYCGKTVDPDMRLFAHVKAAKLNKGRKVAARIAACGSHLRLQVVAIVPAGEKWRVHERQWIKVTRFSFPDNCNTSDGGDGMSMTRASRAKHRKAIFQSERCKVARAHRAIDKMRERTDPIVRMRKRVAKHKAKLRAASISIIR